LFSPIRIGTLAINNRVVFAPVDVGLHTDDRSVDPRYISFVTEVCKDGGVGMVISEFTAVANDQFWVPASRIDDDRFIPGFEKLVNSVHEHGAKIFVQLALLGGRTPRGRAVAPSAIESPLYPKIPEELTKNEIEELIQKWRDAALRSKRVGFDGVEVHGGHSYLVGAFMSPHSNRREDEYGSDFEGRMRFPTDIIRGIKRDCGADYAVGVKFSAYEALENGIQGPLSVDMAQHLEGAGADYLHVSSSTYMLAGTEFPDVPPLFVPQGPLVQFAAQVKKKVAVPVITVAGITTPEKAEEIIEENSADMVALGRALFADPKWAAKAGKGQNEEIIPCIRCNVCHKKIVIDRAGAVECTVNPTLLGYEVRPASSPKRILVAGAGPAGLEAALVASERGHDVLLYEKTGMPGGSLRIGCKPPFKEELRRLLDFYEKRLERSQLSFVTGTPVTGEMIAEERADIVVLAGGAVEYIPPVPGIEKDLVVTARQFYEDDSMQRAEKKRTVILGAGYVGCEIAWHLALLGRYVFLVDILPYDQWLADEHPTNRFILMEQLEQNGVEILDAAENIRVSDESLSLYRRGVHYTVHTDAVILCTGYRSDEELNNGIRESAAGAGAEMHLIGDSAVPRDIHWAIRDGYELGITL
jgi:2,4-dienoyl-CoA reductase-like NADH-dependent reductase (Old Yellow Enzyme family)/thioredoxin reductase